MTRTHPHDAVLTTAIERLSVADTLTDVTGVVAAAVRGLTGADGATFVLREDGKCFYADEDAVSPLWKGSRFPLEACISGWAMLHRTTVTVPDIYLDDRIPHDAYRPTFVRSLVMAPVRAADPVGAIGAYWSDVRTPTAEQVRALEVLAGSAAVALENLELRAAIARRSAERDSLAARTDELEQAIHSMVHDLRSPLAAIVGYADLLESGDATGPEETASFARTIADAGQRMADQIDRMLALYRITSRPVEPGSVDVTALGREVAAEHVARHPGRDLEITVAEGLHAVADPVLTRMLLDNLIGNAVKYTSRTERARIALEAAPTERGPLAAFVVRDNGAGFDPDRSGELFRPMVRLHTAEEFPGTGLGLASVARIAHLHGGTVHAEGAPGSGAAFTFSLPAA